MSRASSVPPDADPPAMRTPNLGRCNQSIRNSINGADRALRVIDQRPGTDRARQLNRQSIVGADRALRVIDPPAQTPPAPTDQNGEAWPITPLGRRDGVFHF